MGDPAAVELVAIAAVAENGVIGADGELPWDSIPEDKRQYKERVADAPVILGRRTYELMLPDVPGRYHIVVSRSQDAFDEERAYAASGVEDAREIAADLGAETAYVIGGEAIYDLFLPHVDRMFLSRIPGAYEGDAYFPEWQGPDWRLAAEVEYDDFTLQEWVRTGAS